MIGMHDAGSEGHAPRRAPTNGSIHPPA
jgi:hypothetical protein